MRVTAEERRKASDYSDFGALVVALKDAVTVLQRITKRPKWEALLCENRVNILADRIDAHVSGDSGEYLASVWTENGKEMWDCDCPHGAYTAKPCSHVQALRTIWKPTIGDKQ